MDNVDNVEKNRYMVAVNLLISKKTAGFGEKGEEWDRKLCELMKKRNPHIYQQDFVDKYVDNVDNLFPK
ncbi:hypothetical protein [Cuneatibacter caecimuris]|uniref:hypothetical protein n=1 Tax=Cuneatibacter caecimuris TaxID=1796618 RepID=UPI0013EEDDFE|nr:hypothetical protein [Cuneatibacter caecimuris]